MKIKVRIEEGRDGPDEKWTVDIDKRDASQDDDPSVSGGNRSLIHE